jgi:hypothetical protein
VCRAGPGLARTTQKTHLYKKYKYTILAFYFICFSNKTCIYTRMSFKKKKERIKIVEKNKLEELYIWKEEENFRCLSLPLSSAFFLFCFVLYTYA